MSCPFANQYDIATINISPHKFIYKKYVVEWSSPQLS